MIMRNFRVGTYTTYYTTPISVQIIYDTENGSVEIERRTYTVRIHYPADFATPSRSTYHPPIPLTSDAKHFLR